MKKIKPLHDGFSDWIAPKMTKYHMACCDCGLVHTMRFKVIKILTRRKGGSWTYKDVKGFGVMFKAARNNRSTAAMRRAKK